MIGTNGPRFRRSLHIGAAAFAATLSAVLVLGVSISAAGDPTPASDDSTPAHVAKVPSSIPAGGVEVNDVILMPPGPTDANTMDRTEALLAASRYTDTGIGRDAILALFTVPGTIPPPDIDIPFRTIEDRLAWVVTVTFPEPQNVDQGGGDPLWVTHYSVALDAHTGEFLWGFYTK